MKKYEMTDNKKSGLTQIRACMDFRDDIKKGDLGGWMQSCKNIFPYGTCWVGQDCEIWGDAVVSEDAIILDHVYMWDEAIVTGNSVVKDNVCIRKNARVKDDAYVAHGVNLSDNVVVYSNACVCGELSLCGYTMIGKNGYVQSEKDYHTLGPFERGDDFVTFYKGYDKRIYVACASFNGSLHEFKKYIKVAYKNNSYYKCRFLRAINYAKSVL